MKRFNLTVGLGSVRPDAEVTNVDGFAEISRAVVEVCRAVVAHDSFDGHVVLTEPANRIRGHLALLMDVRSTSASISGLAPVSGQAVSRTKAVAALRRTRSAYSAEALQLPVRF